MPSSRSRAASITRPVVGIVQHGDAVIRHSKIPAPLRFPIVAVLSMTLSGLLYSLLADLTTAQLVNVIRRNESWLEVGALLGWRTLELALGWFGDYDSYDLASLTLLSHGPPLYLLASFYDVSSTAAILSLLIDAFATYIPFRLLRPLSAAHAASSSKRSPQVANKEIVINSSIQGLTTLLAANVYAITIYAACKTFLPIYLVTYFDDIPSITAAHTADVIKLIPLTLIVGFATRSFIFTPAVATGDTPPAPFDPETASLVETFWYNVWGYSDRKKVVLKRTGTVMLVSGVNTFLQLLFTVEGVAGMGALAYSGVWTVAAGLTGFALSFVSEA